MSIDEKIKKLEEISEKAERGGGEEHPDDTDRVDQNKATQQMGQQSSMGSNKPKDKELH